MLPSLRLQILSNSNTSKFIQPTLNPHIPHASSKKSFTLQIGANPYIYPSPYQHNSAKIIRILVHIHTGITNKPGLIPSSSKTRIIATPGYIYKPSPLVPPMVGLFWLSYWLPPRSHFGRQRLPTFQTTFPTHSFWKEVLFPSHFLYKVFCSTGMLMVLWLQPPKRTSCSGPQIQNQMVGFLCSWKQKFQICCWGMVTKEQINSCCQTRSTVQIFSPKS